jgi:hypothetical protein
MSIRLDHGEDTLGVIHEINVSRSSTLAWAGGGHFALI